MSNSGSAESDSCIRRAAARAGSVYLAGSWRPGEGEESVVSINPTTEARLAHGPGASLQQVDTAARAAASALGEWSTLAVVDRAAIVERIAALLERSNEGLARLVTTEVGTPISASRELQVRSAARVFRSAATHSRTISWRECAGTTEVLKRPLGVIACIAPWNYPLYLIACKVAPALVAGCTVVLKPSEVAPLSAMALAEIIDAAGLPEGVFNLVSGLGPTVGRALVESQSIDAVSFTGSVGAGRSIAAIAGQGIKRVTLELGGKSAVVALDGGSLESAVQAAVGKCFQNAGQTCAAHSRLIVPAPLLDKAEALAVACAESYRPGDPMDAATRLGPLATAGQLDRVRSHISDGLREGAQLLTGGAERPAEMPRGWFVKPTVFSKVEPSMRLAQEEIFGPVLSIMHSRDDEHALEIANSTGYGLSGAVWAVDDQRAARFAGRVRAGSVAINGGSVNPDAPFGGFRLSGFGRERGRHGIEEFLTTQALHHARTVVEPA